MLDTPAARSTRSPPSGCGSSCAAGPTARSRGSRCSRPSLAARPVHAEPARTSTTSTTSAGTRRPSTSPTCPTSRPGCATCRPRSARRCAGSSRASSRSWPTSTTWSPACSTCCGDTGQLARTWIFFVSDNGYLLGEHRLFRKEQPYEESAGIPFVVRGPGLAPGTADAFVSQVDLMPTTLDIAGLDPDAGRALDGRSLLDPLRTGDWAAGDSGCWSRTPTSAGRWCARARRRTSTTTTATSGSSTTSPTDPHQLASLADDRPRRRGRLGGQGRRPARSDGNRPPRPRGVTLRTHRGRAASVAATVEPATSSPPEATSASGGGRGPDRPTTPRCPGAARCCPARRGRR